MASSVVQSNKNFKRLQSRKSHSWWWGSHISPKNSKWLAENLEEMERSVRRMLKLIEEDGDSFAKKAEMYYQKRPELISLVEEFYRMYRSLAERYDHVTGELRKNIPSDLQSQGSGISISDISSETSTWPTLVSDLRTPRPKSAHRAAGFEFFLRSSSDIQREGDDTSTLTDSESESDVSSVSNYTGLLGNSGDQALSKKIIELETELREMRERLQVQQDENGDGSFREMRNDISDDVVARILGYEQDLKIANQRLRESEEVARLKIDLQKYKQPDDLEFDITEEYNAKIQALAEELRTTNEKLQCAEKEIASFQYQIDSKRPSDRTSVQEQLELSQKDVNTWKTKYNAQKKEISKLQERVTRLKTSLSDRDHEVRDLKIAVSDAEEKIFPEKAQIKTEIAKLLKERTSLQEQLRESESRGRSLEDEIRMLQAEMSEREEILNQLKEEIAKQDEHIENLNKRIDALKLEREEADAQVCSLKVEAKCRDEQMDKHLQQLHTEHVELLAGAEGACKLIDKLRSKVRDLEEEIERQRIAIEEGAEEKREAIRQLCFSLDHYRNGYEMLRQAFVGHKRVPVLAA